MPLPTPTQPTAPTTHLLYLHGFRSSPQSTKARQMAALMAQRLPDVTWWCPQLPPSPQMAMELIQNGTANWPKASMAVIGSSLGGFYATCLAAQTGCKAVLLNPAVYPARDLAQHIGVHTSWHDPADTFVFKPEYIVELERLSPSSLNSSLSISEQVQSNTFLIAAKGDEVLDWREMTARYPSAQLKLLEGSDHALSDFDDHIATLFEACFADTAAIRVTTKDASGTPTALSAACSALPFAANYLSGGFTAMQNYSDRLKNDDYTGAKFNKPEILFTAPNGQVFYRMPYQTAAGVGRLVTDIAQKTSPAGKVYAWETVGNQRIYDLSVQARLENSTQLNPANTSNNNSSVYKVGLGLFFNPSNTAGKNVQAIRVKGPGLPDAGVVMHRSNQCNTSGYMSVTNKIGTLTNTSNQSIGYNSNTGNNFNLAVEGKTGTFDYSKVTTNRTWRDTAMTDTELAAIPSFAQYTWEIWNFLPGPAYRGTITNATPPDAIVYSRIGSRVPSIGSLKSMAWNTINTSDFLNPASSLAAAQTTGTIGWKSVAEPVDRVFMYGERAAPPAAFLRASAGSSVKISETSKTLTFVAETSGTDELPIGMNIPHSSCSTVQFPSFDAVAGTNVSGIYTGTNRSMTVRSRSFNLARKYVTNAWNNYPN